MVLEATMDHEGNHITIGLKVQSGRQYDPGLSAITLALPDDASWSDVATAMRRGAREAEKYAELDVLERCKGEKA